MLSCRGLRRRVGCRTSVNVSEVNVITIVGASVPIRKPNQVNSKAGVADHKEFCEISFGQPEAVLAKEVPSYGELVGRHIHCFAIATMSVVARPREAEAVALHTLPEYLPELTDADSFRRGRCAVVEQVDVAGVFESRVVLLHSSLSENEVIEGQP